MTRRATIARDDAGHPILLADVPNSGVQTRRRTGRTGGNVRHDSRSGKFAPSPGDQPGGEEDQPRRVVLNAQEEELARYFDAVRDAAREFDDWGEGDVREFLQGRAKDMSVVDVQQFILRVRRQRLDDITDILDTSLRRSGSRVTTRRRVRIVAPKGWLTRATNSLAPEEVAEVARRLVARGHDREDVVSSFTKRVSDERRQAIEQSLGTVEE